MAFNFPAFSYIIALIIDAFLIFFSIFHVNIFQAIISLLFNFFKNSNIAKKLFFSTFKSANNQNFKRLNTISVS